MNSGRFVAPGRTRSCPHCKATILDSASVCPGCHHHLRFDSASGQRPQTADTPLRVDGILRHTADGGAWEYSIVLAIRNGRGEEISRQVVGVGALQPAEERTFSLAVEVFKPLEVSKSAEAPKLHTAAGVAGAAGVAAGVASAAGLSASSAASAPTGASAAAGASASARAPAPPPASTLSRPATAAGTAVTRPPEPRIPAPGRNVPPGFGPPGLGRDPARREPSPSRSAGLKDPRLAASDPNRQPKRS